ncbi:MAG: NAD(P)/FAD-dependent oxidoreductase, partial [Pseudomonadota bacterium]
MSRSVLICGAGIGGLAAAALLAADGADVMLVEQAPAPAPVGSGLVVQPVGKAVLDLLGVGEAVAALGAPISRLYGKSGDRVVLDARYDPAAARRLGLAVQRRTLFEALMGAAEAAGATLRFGAEVAAADPHAGWVRLTGGEVIEADLIVDALGARSPLSPKPGKPLAYGALWASLAWPEDAGFDKSHLEQRYERASKMAGVLPVGAAASDPTFRAAYFWSLRRDRFADWRARPIEDWKAEALSLWPETAPLLDQIGAHDDLTEARYLHRTLADPVTDRIVHLGDSWHATSPQLGQGANMALLD